MPETGNYEPSPMCAMCGKPKTAGRKALTCQDCSDKRARILKTPGADRCEIVLTSCANCGVRTGRGTNYLCRPCSASFQAWKSTSENYRQVRVMIPVSVWLELADEADAMPEKPTVDGLLSDLVVARSERRKKNKK